MVGMPPWCIYRVYHGGYASLVYIQGVPWWGMPPCVCVPQGVPWWVYLPGCIPQCVHGGYTSLGVYLSAQSGASLPLAIPSAQSGASLPLALSPLRRVMPLLL